MSVILVVQPPRVLVSGADPVLMLAASELVRYTAAAKGPALDRVETRRSLRRRVWRIPAGADCAVWTEPLRIHARDPQAMLRAVYRHLERTGWRWYFPGPLGEVYRPGSPPPVPGDGQRTIAERIVVERLSDLDQPGWASETCRLAAWLPRRGWNCLAVEGRRIDPGELAVVAEELAARGLDFEVGGDVVPRLLAKTRDAGQATQPRRQTVPRADRLEVADSAALAALPRVAAAELARHPTARALRLAEPAEAPLRADEPGLLPAAGARFSAVLEAIVRGLGDARKLVLWRPTSAMRRGLRVPEGALLTWIAEGGAPRPSGGAEASLPCADLHWQRGLTAPALHTIAADVRALASAGVDRVSTTVQGAASWWAYPLNLYGLSLLLDDPELTPGDILSDWCGGLYGRAAEPMRQYLTAFEAAMAPLWPLRRVPDEVEPFRTPAALSELNRAVTVLPSVRRQLTEAFAAADDPTVQTRLAREASVFDLNTFHVRLRFLRLQALLGHPTLALHAAARELVTALIEHLERLPVGATGLALRRDYLDVVLDLARWCGHEADRVALRGDGEAPV